MAGVAASLQALPPPPTWQVAPGKYAIDFNRNRGAISGFLPIHAVVAFSLTDMRVT